VAALLARARTATDSRLTRSRDDLGHLRERVAALSPAATLARGYAVVQTADGSVLRDPADAPVGSALRLRLGGGDLAASSQGPWTGRPPANTDPGTTAASAKATSPRKRTTRSGPREGGTVKVEP
jgi:exodeoxyribonuclease VII large subunit